jgi:hypothetical protein
MNGTAHGALGLIPDFARMDMVLAFPIQNHFDEPCSKIVRRHHVHPSNLQIFRFLNYAEPITYALLPKKRIGLNSFRMITVFQG